jgi:ElaB/YqjD/DUF883 family membrane-anchored ribosome-binding protein
MTDTTGSIKDAAQKGNDQLKDLTADLKDAMTDGAKALTERYGDAISSLRDVAGRNPAATLAVVAGVCFLLGAAWARRD